VAGFVAPRHLEAIRTTGNRLIAAADLHDAVGVLDRYAFDVRFFTEIERFDRHLEKLRSGPNAYRVHYHIEQPHRPRLQRRTECGDLAGSDRRQQRAGWVCACGITLSRTAARIELTTAGWRSFPS
jgi:hypothetical protein